jgi:3-oxoadipate enol-lactonase
MLHCVIQLEHCFNSNTQSNNGGIPQMHYGLKAAVTEGAYIMTPDGARVSYARARPAHQTNVPCVILIHGAGMSARSWARQLHALSARAQILAIDLPGHGDSDAIAEASVENYAQSVADLMDELAIGPLFVVGHSLGGAVGMALAAQRSDQVQGLVLISSCAKAPRNSGAIQAMLGLLPAPMRRILFFSTARRVLFGAGAADDMVQLALKDLRKCKPQTVRQDMQAAEAMDLESTAQNLRVPTLVLCGTHDMITPLAMSQRLRDLIHGAQLRVVDRAGHMLPLEAAEQVNQEIVAFVDRTARANLQESEPQLPVKSHMVRQLFDRVRAFCARKRRHATRRSLVSGRTKRFASPEAERGERF